MPFAIRVENYTIFLERLITYIFLFSALLDFLVAHHQISDYHSLDITGSMRGFPYGLNTTNRKTLGAHELSVRTLSQ